MVLAHDERFEGPHSPKGDDDGKRIVLANHALVASHLQLQVIAQQAGMFFRVIRQQRFVFACRKIRERSVGPDLAVRVRVAGAHELAAILENLNVATQGISASSENCSAQASTTTRNSGTSKRGTV